MSDAISAAVAAEMFPPPPGGRTAEELRAEAEALVPVDVSEFDETYRTAYGVTNVEGPWPRWLVVALVVRGISKGATVAVEYSELVIRHTNDSSSTLRPAGAAPVRPDADPMGCRYCGLTRRHGEQPTTWGTHAYTKPTQFQIKARMLERRKKAGK
ncbi:hypothetical protein [Streptomyces regalis]|uniref:Uncharacterized protein n=1 Tax=Streptomyces regalis TaxID=68262 RepID=A0A117ML09_9ACTN|nr:hypothetical protein [Streptomyces regalis]KUL23185.1 hypothetical protein ADL12_39590 [Streptomyces regalis]